MAIEIKITEIIEIIEIIGTIEITEITEIGIETEMIKNFRKRKKFT